MLCFRKCIQNGVCVPLACCYGGSLMLPWSCTSSCACFLWSPCLCPTATCSLSLVSRCTDSSYCSGVICRVGNWFKAVYNRSDIQEISKGKCVYTCMCRVCVVIPKVHCKKNTVIVKSWYAILICFAIILCHIKCAAISDLNSVKFSAGDYCISELMWLLHIKFEAIIMWFEGLKFTLW